MTLFKMNQFLLHVSFIPVFFPDLLKVCVCPVLFHSLLNFDCSQHYVSDSDAVGFTLWKDSDLQWDLQNCTGAP